MTLQPGIEQFNLDVTELEAHAPSLQPWRSKRTGAGGTRQEAHVHEPREKRGEYKKNKGVAARAFAPADGGHV